MAADSPKRLTAKQVAEAEKAGNTLYKTRDGVAFLTRLERRAWRAAHRKESK